VQFRPTFDGGVMKIDVFLVTGLSWQKLPDVLLEAEAFLFRAIRLILRLDG
jgi:hypothetical protein